ncbi:MAG: hypothetical protein ACWA5L_05040 [bacterium]
MRMAFRILALLAGLGILLIGAGLFYLNELNFFNTYKSANIANCKAIVGLAGVEDIAPDDQHQRAWLSVMDRRRPKDSKDNSPPRGKIIAFDPQNPLDTGSWRDRSQGAPEQFEPLGLSYFEDENVRRLFVINRADHSILIYNITTENHLELDRRLSDFRLTSPSNIVAVGPDSFYVSNDVGGGRFAVRKKIDFLTRAPTGMVLYYDGLSWSNAIQSLRFPDGLAVSAQKDILYIAEKSAKNIAIYSRDITTGILTHVADRPLTAFPNNLYLDDFLYVGVQMKPLAHFIHMRNHSSKSPSGIFRYTPSDHDLIAIDPIIISDGTEISGATIAAILQDKMLIGSFADNKILSCPSPQPASLKETASQ